MARGPSMMAIRTDPKGQLRRAETLVPVDGVQYTLLVNRMSITPYVVSSEDRGHTLRVSASWGMMMIS